MDEPMLLVVYEIPNLPFIVVGCPFCDLQMGFDVNDIICGIFRHGGYESEGRLEVLPPHATEQEINAIKGREGVKFYGCGLPLKIVVEHGKVKLYKIGYL